MILIVDDDKVVRLSLSLLLKTAGHEVVAVESPDEAVDIARGNHSLRLVITDMNFTRATTGEEGLELLRRLKVLRPEVPVMLITAWGSIPPGSGRDALRGFRFHNEALEQPYTAATGINCIIPFRNHPADHLRHIRPLGHHRQQPCPDRNARNGRTRRPHRCPGAYPW